MCNIRFLGTGGGRFVFLSQKRNSGGIWLELCGANILVDPGPGSLVRALDAGVDPGLLDCIISSHKHLDHYNDVEVMVEAMTHGLNKRQGLLVLQGDVEGYISEYHRGRVETLIADWGNIFNVGDVKCEVLPTSNHVGCLGFRFKTSCGDIVYSGDSAYSDDLAKSYIGAKLLILNTTFPPGRSASTHLCVDDAVRIVDVARPDHCVLTHFGVQMIEHGPEVHARFVEDATGVKTTAATDGLKISI